MDTEELRPANLFIFTFLNIIFVMIESWKYFLFLSNVCGPADPGIYIFLF